MRTLLIRGDGEVPPRVREILRAGSTEVKEIRADEVRDRTAHIDRVVYWNRGEIELRDDTPGTPATRLRWPQEEEKLRLLFQTAG